MRTVEELVGSMAGDEWHSLPRWKRIPSLEAGTSHQGVPGLHSSLACHAVLLAVMGSMTAAAAATCAKFSCSVSPSAAALVYFTLPLQSPTSCTRQACCRPSGSSSRAETATWRRASWRCTACSSPAMKVGPGVADRADYLTKCRDCNTQSGSGMLMQLCTC